MSLLANWYFGNWFQVDSCSNIHLFVENLNMKYYILLRSNMDLAHMDLCWMRLCLQLI